MNLSEMLEEGLGKKIKVVAWVIVTIIIVAVSIITLVLMMLFSTEKASTMAAEAICIAIMLAWLVFTASMMFAPGDWKMTLIRVVVISLVAALCRYCAPITDSPGLAIILGLAVIGTIFIMAAWWHSDGSSFSEFIIFLIIDFMLTRVSLCGMMRIYSLTDGWITGAVTAIPWIAFVMSAGYFLTDMIGFNMEAKEDNEDFDPYKYLNI